MSTKKRSAASDLSFSIAQGMRPIDREAWDRLAERSGTPLLSWGFLSLLEESHSICPETGWTPVHFLLHRNNELAAAAPFYARTHSMGDFVFDQEFALWAQEVGAPYYPKLVGMVPATPAPAWRILTAPGGDALSSALLKVVQDTARASNFGALQINWPAEGFCPDRTLQDDGRIDQPGGRAQPEWLAWRHGVFLWTDQGYGDFQGYLQSLTKNMRRNILRERTAVASAGIRTRIIPGREAADMQAAAASEGRRGILDSMADYYEATNDQFGPWGAKFLTRDFFLRLPEFMPGGWCLSAGFRTEDTLEREPIGLALLFQGRDRLYGRYWGAAERIDGLHFELCYYLPIEYALAQGLGSFDPGLGSSHKARRGFRSILSPSYHMAFDSRVQAVFAKYLPLLSRAEADQVEELNRELPFKRES